jgi:hypothetical protein
MLLRPDGCTRQREDRDHPTQENKFVESHRFRAARLPDASPPFNAAPVAGVRRWKPRQRTPPARIAYHLERKMIVD